MYGAALEFSIPSSEAFLAPYANAVVFWSHLCAGKKKVDMNIFAGLRLFSCVTPERWGTI